MRGMDEVLRHYDIGAVQQILPAGGTAGRTWRIAAAGGDYFLRMRGVRTSADARLRFDHGLRVHLIARGVPTAAAVLTRDGARWLRWQERVYELYPFVEGRPFDPRDERHLLAAARGLARFHRAAADYRPPAAGVEPVAQYTTLGISDGVSDRMDDPRLLLLHLRAMRDAAGDAAARALLDRCLIRAEALAAGYAGAAYQTLAGWVIHGDYTPANLLFSAGGDVAGIFDLDWAYPGARCRDVADALYFFGSQPRQVDPSDIWSLTAAAEFDPDRCRAFLDAYGRVSPLQPAEIKAIPLAFAGRWFSIRLEGMAKVAVADRFCFFARDIEGPLTQLDAIWPFTV